MDVRQACQPYHYSGSSTLLVTTGKLLKFQGRKDRWHKKRYGPLLISPQARTFKVPNISHSNSSILFLQLLLLCLLQMLSDTIKTCQANSNQLQLAHRASANGAGIGQHNSLFCSQHKFSCYFTNFSHVHKYLIFIAY